MLDPGPPGNIGILKSGDIQFDGISNFTVQLNGTVPGTQFDQLQVTGSVTLNNAPTLNVSLGPTSVTQGSLYKIIDNDGSEPVLGNFSGLGEGAIFTVGLKTFRISYTGGDGNDVVLILIATGDFNEAPPTDINLSNTSVAENLGFGTVVGNLSTTDLDAGDTFTYALVSGLGSTDNGSFQIVGNQLQAAASFDYETKNSYSIRIRSTDAAGLSVAKSFNVAVTNVTEFRPGDTNKDGIFNSIDLVLAFQAGEYEDGLPKNSTWEEGDWSGDGDFGSSDIILAFQQPGYSAEAQATDLWFAEWGNSLANVRPIASPLGAS